MNVALYARVSTEEQAKHGISIDAQVSSLRLWAQDQGHTIVGEYIDNGVSARKAPSKRPDLQRLLEEIPSKHIELIAFTKLDRWTRNVKGYYQVQEILDRNKVAWVAVQEDYETITASGRFKVNIMLSVAENEADRTSERIRTVFERKVELGQPITKSVPLGYRLQGKSVVPDNCAPIAVFAFERYAQIGNKAQVRQEIEDRYGLRMSTVAMNNLLHNPMYIGHYRDNPQFCAPLIARDLWDRVQHDMEERGTSQTHSGRVYLFSGLIRCKECGRRMAGTCYREGVIYYRCKVGHWEYHDCAMSVSLRESNLEEEAVNAISGFVSGAMTQFQPKVAESHTANKNAVKRKLERLRQLFVEGDIEIEEYRKRRDDLTALLEEQPAPKRQLTIRGDDFRSEYAAMTREQQKMFWRSVIDHIDWDGENADIFLSV